MSQIQFLLHYVLKKPDNLVVSLRTFAPELLALQGCRRTCTFCHQGSKLFVANKWQLLSSTRLSTCKPNVHITDVSNTSFLVGALYSHPNNNTKHFGEILENSVNILNMERKTFYVLGDFNINALSSNTVDKRFINNMQSIGAHQMITLPTRFPTYKNHHYMTTYIVMTLCMNYSLVYYNMISVITIPSFF